MLRSEGSGASSAGGSGRRSRALGGAGNGGASSPERAAGPGSSISLGASASPGSAASGSDAAGGASGSERLAKRLRSASHSGAQAAQPALGAQAEAAMELFGVAGESGGRLFLGAQTATVEWRIEKFQIQRQRADGVCLDGPKFGQREPWQIFCHPDGRCFNQPQGGPPGVFLRYLGPHERVPAYATIEKLSDGEFRVPENNARDAPFVVLFGRNEIEEWGVCKDFGLFDEAFGRSLCEEALVLRARVAWIEPRADGLLPREVVAVSHNRAPIFAGAEGSLQADLGTLWNARGRGAPVCAGRSGGPAAAGACPPVPAADVVLVCEQQRFDADRAILAARSSFFGAMFAGGQFREAAQKEVELPDFPARAMASALRFIYTDEGPELRSQDEAEELLTASSKLGINGLLWLCSDYLRDNWLTVPSAVALLRLADTHGATSLRAEALAVLGASFDQVKGSPEWDDLLRSGMNPALIQDTMQAVADASIFAGRASIKQ